MPDTLLLTADEIADLTGRQRPDAQCRALQRLGIAFLLDPFDGLPKVTRAYVEWWRAEREAARGRTRRLAPADA